MKHITLLLLFVASAASADWRDGLAKTEETVRNLDASTMSESERFMQCSLTIDEDRKVKNAAAELEESINEDEERLGNIKARINGIESEREYLQGQMDFHARGGFGTSVAEHNNLADEYNELGREGRAMERDYNAYVDVYSDKVEMLNEVRQRWSAAAGALWDKLGCSSNWSNDLVVAACGEYISTTASMCAAMGK